MTRLDIMAMSEDEINLRVARNIMKLDVREFKSEHMGKSLSGMLVYEKLGNLDCPIGNLPEYTKDLNLCYQVEEKIKEMNDYYLKSNYCHKLWRLNGSVGTFIDDSIDLFELIHASPIDRMRAALSCLL